MFLTHLSHILHSYIYLHLIRIKAANTWTCMYIKDLFTKQEPFLLISFLIWVSLTSIK